MRLSAESWRMRGEAREALSSAEFQRAGELADQAQQAQSTNAGAALRLLCKWLAAKT